MNGILLKEFLYIKVQKRAILSILIIAVMFYVMMLNNNKAPTPVELSSLLGVLMAMLSATETFNSLASDEKAKWDGYVKSLPVSTAAIVGSKYLFTMILSAAGALLGTVILFAVSKGHPDTDVLLILLIITFGVSALICSVELPLFYRFGLQKSDLVVLCIFCLGPLVLSRIFPGDFTGVSDAQAFFLLKLSPLVILAVLLISFCISWGVYKRRQR